MANNASKTILDIAQELGISKTTVADALKGTGRVAPATRELVEATAARFGYAPNKSARQLRTRSSEMVGLYIGSDVRNMPFYMPFTFGVLEEMARQSFDLTLISHVPAGGFSQFAGILVIDALPDDEVLHAILEREVPVVSAGRLENPHRSTAGSILIDYAATTSTALDLLGENGGGHPALIAPEPRDPLAWSEQIVAAYRHWCEQAGVPSTVLRLPPYATNEELKRALDEALLDPNVNGLVFSWQEIADRAQVMLSNREASARPKIASLINSFVEGGNYPHDVLVDLDARTFGAEAAALMCSVLAHPLSDRPQMLHEVRVRLSETAFATP